MHIRKMYPTEGKKLAELVYTSVHTLCTADYTEEELTAWAPKNMDMPRFNASLFRSHTCVAVENGHIIGFVSIEHDGYVNRLFTHPDFIRRGIATALLCEAEDWARRRKIKRIRLAASKTGVEFYKKRGYRITDVETVSRKGVTFHNKIMEKYL